MENTDSQTDTAGGELSFAEARVLGCLMEKEAATPEYYPLTIASLTTACNQKSNRFPVVEWEPRAVEVALESLRRKRLAVMISMAGSRGPKYKHTIENVYGGLDAGMRAILCELLLRNGQTVNELRARTERMHGFPSPEAAEECAMKLVNYPVAPMVAVLPPGAGRRVKTYVHLLCGPIDASALSAPAAPAAEVPPPEDWKARMESELAALRSELDRIKSALGIE